MTDAEELEMLELEEQEAQANASRPKSPEQLSDLMGQELEKVRQKDLLRDVAFGRGAAQGATFGFGDEIGGGIQALGEKYLPESLGGGGEASRKKTLAELYRANRDAFRGENVASESEHPWLYGLGTVAGGAATTPLVPGLSGTKAGAALVRAGLGPRAAAILGRLVAAGGNGVLQGGAFGAGTSGADLTQGETGRFGGDVLRGSKIGGGLGLGTAALGEASGALANRFARRAGEAASKAGALGAEGAAEGVASARGTAGRAVADANATLRTLRESLVDPAISKDRKAAISAFLESPAGIQLRDEVAANALEAAPEKVQAAQTAKALHRAAMEQEPEEAARLAKQALSLKEAVNQAGQRVMRYGLPAVTAAVGHHAMGPIGGLAEGAVLRPMFHSMKRMASHPAIAYRTARLGQALTGGLSRALSAAAERPSILAAPAESEDAQLQAAIAQALRNRTAEAQ